MQSSYVENGMVQNTTQFTVIYKYRSRIRPFYRY